MAVIYSLKYIFLSHGRSCSYQLILLTMVCLFPKQVVVMCYFSGTVLSLIETCQMYYLDFRKAIAAIYCCNDNIFSGGNSSYFLRICYSLMFFFGEATLVGQISLKHLHFLTRLLLKGASFCDKYFFRTLVRILFQYSCFFRRAAS